MREHDGLVLDQGPIPTRKLEPDKGHLQRQCVERTCSSRSRPL